MFRSALISLDYSAAQGPLLECLTDLRDMGIKRVVLTHIVRIGYGQGAGYGQKDVLEEWLRLRAAPLRELGFEVEIDIRAAGEVAKDILLASEEHGADLIVIGSRGQNMVRGLFLGSVAREVLRLSLLPVRLEWIEATGKDGAAACERACHAGLQQLLLATDFSPQASAAEAAVTQLAPAAGNVHLVHVLSPAERERYTLWPVMARAALDSIAANITAADGTAEVHLAEGRPAEEIARIATEREADLIVVGKHGQGWLKSLATGSTATVLCEIARRPVLVMPVKEEKV